MTAPTITPYRSDTPPGRDGFAQLVRAEWTKLRTVRGWIIGAIIAALVTMGLRMDFAVESFGGSSSCNSVGSGPAPAAAGPVRRTFTEGPGGEPVTDNFYFVRQPLAGNGSITVRVTSLTGELPINTNGLGNPNQQLPMRPGLQPWAKAGFSSLRRTAPRAGIGIRGPSWSPETTGCACSPTTPRTRRACPVPVSAANPRWLRLTRSGDTLTGYDSADGTHWTRVGSVRLAGLPATVAVRAVHHVPDLPVAHRKLRRRVERQRGTQRGHGGLRPGGPRRFRGHLAPGPGAMSARR